MKAPDFNGVFVNHNGKEVAIIKIEGNYIWLDEKNSDGKDFQLVYPSSFFATETGHQKFLTTENPILLEKINEDAMGHICQNCKKYCREVVSKKGPISSKVLCDSCYGMELKNIRICSMCNKRFYSEDGGVDCAGQFLCKECNAKRLRWKSVDFTKNRKVSTVKVCYRIPAEYKGKYENVRVRAGFIKGRHCSVHEIDFLYHNERREYLCLATVLNLMQEKYGMLLLDTIPAKDQLPYLAYCHRFDSSYFKMDSILSRWGYVAQSDKQSDFERRAIISSILYYHPEAKGEIEQHLSNLIYYRSEKCHYATPIWESDLLFLVEKNIDERVIDMTESLQDFCEKRGIVFENG